MTHATGNAAGTDYGIDAPSVMRNFFIAGFVCLLAGLLLPRDVHLGSQVTLKARSFLWPASIFLAEGSLFLLYVKYGKFRHRDFMLSLHTWRGDEHVLDVGCGRGLLLAGAAKRLTSGRATGIDIWSNEDMGDNSVQATRRNLDLEGVAARCELVSAPAQEMPFPCDTFDVVVSNLCLHNIYDRPTRLKALDRIRQVLKPGGVLLLSDYKLTREYAGYLREAGLTVTHRWGSFLTTFPPLKVVLARKPQA